MSHRLRATMGRSSLRSVIKPSLARFSSNSAEAAAAPEAAAPPSATGISVVDFLKSIGQGVESHADKIAKKVETLDELLLIRRMKLKKIEVPCKQLAQVNDLHFPKQVMSLESLRGR